MKSFLSKYKYSVIFVSGFVAAILIFSLIFLLAKNLTISVQQKNNNTISSVVEVSPTATISLNYTTTPTPIVTIKITNSQTALLPLGDGKVTKTGAEKGYVYRCGSETNGGGAETNGNWIIGNQWDPTKKINVLGDVHWPNAKITVAVQGDKRVITGNDLPTNHNTGIFPIASTDPAYKVDRNPNKISAQTLSFSLPASPTFATIPQCMGGGPIGIMLSGVVLFDALDAEERDAPAHEVQDKCGGHPEKTGEYHYHNLSECLPDAHTNKLLGYAFDGFGIYGDKDSNGNPISTNDLDECHGITSTVDWDGKKVNMYHYVMTRDYPYSVGCYKGNPVRTNPQPNSGTMMSPPPMMPR